MTTLSTSPLPRAPPTTPLVKKKNKRARSSDDDDEDRSKKTKKQTIPVGKMIRAVGRQPAEKVVEAMTEAGMRSFLLKLFDFVGSTLTDSERKASSFLTGQKPTIVDVPLSAQVLEDIARKKSEKQFRKKRVDDKSVTMISSGHFAIGDRVPAFARLALRPFKIREPELGYGDQVRSQRLAQELALDPDSGIIGPRWNVSNQVRKLRGLPRQIE